MIKNRWRSGEWNNNHILHTIRSIVECYELHRQQRVLNRVVWNVAVCYKVFWAIIKRNSFIFRMSAATVEERDEWIECLRRSISHNPFYDMLAQRKKKAQHNVHNAH